MLPRIAWMLFQEACLTLNEIEKPDTVDNDTRQRRSVFYKSFFFFLKKKRPKSLKSPIEFEAAAKKTCKQEGHPGCLANHALDSPVCSTNVQLLKVGWQLLVHSALPLGVGSLFVTSINQLINGPGLNRNMHTRLGRSLIHACLTFLNFNTIKKPLQAKVNYLEGCKLYQAMMN